ncbi:LPXTG cell wall anchor domain-containing protein [Streptomyces cellulosae]|uniref:LPXTG cell wall anchor domain-containing protein n=1 Tax=Streptomyces cellulosae TaxID=1968 RepID=UPI00387E8B10
MAGAATSILSLYVIPAFASAQTDGPLEGTLGALSGASAPDLPVSDPANACPASVGVSADPSVGKPCNSVADSRAAHGAAHASAPKGRDSSAGYGDDDSGSGGGVGQIDDRQGAGDSLGGVLGPGDPGNPLGGVLGHGDGDGGDWDYDEPGQGGDWDYDPGQGDESGYGDDGDPPPTTPPTTTPPTTPPVSPPATKPPAKTPPRHTPPTTPPAQPPTLPQTGGGAGTVAGTGVAALLITGGVALYRRGRTTSGR